MINRNIFIVIFLSLVCRIFAILFYGDQSLSAEEANEWGVIYENLKNYGTMSWFGHENIKYPTVFMPPLYVFYIYSLSFITEKYLVDLILYTQCIISVFSSILFYNICKYFFDKKISYIGLILFTFYPIYIYAASQISSINIVILINLFFIFSILKFRNYILIGIIGGIGLLSRGEFILLYIVSLFYLFWVYQFSIKKIFLVCVISFFVVSPYLYRNYITFNKVVITNSSGYVLWRGNNNLSTIDSIAADKEIQILENQKNKNYEFKNEELKKLDKELNKIKFNKKYDILRDEIFLRQAKENIVNDPKRYLSLYFKKLFSFLFFNYESNYKNYYNPINIIPEILLSLTGFLGTIIALKKFRKFSFFYIYLFYNLAIYSVFLILPRYKIIILPAIIIFSLYFISFLIGLFKKNSNKV